MAHSPDPRATPRRLKTAAALVAATIAATAVGVPIAVADRADDATVTPRARADTAEMTELGDVTLDELADSLAELGLELTIGPFDSAGGAAGDDPFAGMTDEEIDALSDEEFFALLDQAEELGDGDAGSTVSDEIHDDGEDPGESADFGAEETPVASFAVAGDTVESGTAAQADVAAAREIWERFATLIPADQRQMVVRFELMPAAYGGAHVYPSDDDPTTWVLGVSQGLGDDLDFVLIHEFGHLLTLQVKEVPPSDDADGCTTYFTGEGCALSGSTFAEFVERFWPQELRDEREAAEDWQAAEDFYERYADSFVSDYAATNPGEDLADTFAVFVTTDRPSGTTIADQKLQFLWDDPDMVELRDEIRAAQ